MPIMVDTSVGGVADDMLWQTRWRLLAMVPARRYDVLGEKAGRRFIQALIKDLNGVKVQRLNEA